MSIRRAPAMLSPRTSPGFGHRLEWEEDGAWAPSFLHPSALHRAWPQAAPRQPCTQLSKPSCFQLSSCLQIPACEHWPCPWRGGPTLLPPSCHPPAILLPSSCHQRVWGSLLFVIMDCEVLAKRELPEAIGLDHAFANTHKVVSFPLR